MRGLLRKPPHRSDARVRGSLPTTCQRPDKGGQMMTLLPTDSLSGTCSCGRTLAYAQAMIVRCTNKLLQLLEARAASLVQAPPTEDDWYANLLWLDRRKCLLLTHDGTLFSVVTADMHKRDLQPFGVYLVRISRPGSGKSTCQATPSANSIRIRFDLPARPVAACSAS